MSDETERCASTHPTTGDRCERADHHAGPHQVRRGGGVDRWAPAGMTLDMRDDVTLT